jgi:hypothetical protein
MNILLIYPEFPDTFWSFKHALAFVGKRSAFARFAKISGWSGERIWERRGIAIELNTR